MKKKKKKNDENINEMMKWNKEKDKIKMKKKWMILKNEI